jgi:hypothetical protein
MRQLQKCSLTALKRSSAIDIQAAGAHTGRLRPGYPGLFIEGVTGAKHTGSVWLHGHHISHSSSAAACFAEGALHAFACMHAFRMTRRFLVTRTQQVRASSGLSSILLRLQSMFARGWGCVHHVSWCVSGMLHKHLWTMVSSFFGAGRARQLRCCCCCLTQQDTPLAYAFLRSGHALSVMASVHQSSTC